MVSNYKFLVSTSQYQRKCWRIWVNTSSVRMIKVPDLNFLENQENHFTTLWIGWESTFCWQTTIPGVLENISCRWNDNSCSMILGVLRKYAFQSHTFRWTRPSGKPQTSAWLTVEDSFSAATTSKTEEQKRKRFFLIRPKHRSRMNLKCPAFITL